MFWSILYYYIYQPYNDCDIYTSINRPKKKFKWMVDIQLVVRKANTLNVEYLISVPYRQSISSWIWSCPPYLFLCRTVSSGSSPLFAILRLPRDDYLSSTKQRSVVAQHWAFDVVPHLFQVHYGLQGNPLLYGHSPLLDVHPGYRDVTRWREYWESWSIQGFLRVHFVLQHVEKNLHVKVKVHISAMHFI